MSRSSNSVLTADRGAQPGNQRGDQGGEQSSGAGTPAENLTRAEKKAARKAEKAARKDQMVPVLPSVNILSAWVFERMAISRLRKRFALAAFVLVLLIAGGWTLQGLRIDQAEKVLAVEQAETSRLTAETSTLTPVKAFVATVGQQELTVKNNMAAEIYFSRVLEELQNATPYAANVETVSVALDPGAGSVALGKEPAVGESIPVESPCPGPDPFNTKLVIGCITLSGSAGSRADVGEFVINLGNEELFVEPFISTTTAGDGTGVTFNGSVGLSEKVYSRRYAELQKVLKAEGVR